MKEKQANKVLKEQNINFLYNIKVSEETLKFGNFIVTCF